ncbi:hypothetical protein G7Y79_00040g076660 [Physcia stellaris]|nr:hypothetical protein G7Y79_00040g076660 [Physcia stellaris]
MEAGLAAGYAVETAAEGAVGAGIALAKSTMPLKAKWKRIYTGTPLPRSSHSLSIVRGVAYIFGGEEHPREPVDNDMHLVTLPSSGADADYKKLSASPSVEGGEVPTARVGHTANAIDDRIYVFGGRGGKAMEPLAENGRVWVFDTMAAKWSYLDPAEGSNFPEARSYHASAATAHPLHTSHDQLESRFDTLPVDMKAHGTIFIHGGCPAKGRLGDLWAFDIASRSWSAYPDAPGPARGGPSLTYSFKRLYRYGGFDGKHELGGQIDYLDISVSSAAKGESISHDGQWKSVEVPPDAASPGNRSVAGLHPVTTGQGRNYLLLLLGEGSPSSSGHDAAGQFWDSVWSFQLQPESMTAASLKDATRRLLHAKTGEGVWAQVDIPESTKQEGQLEGPGPRGWFASAQGHDIGTETVVLWGGVQESNERAADGWILVVES